MELTEIATRELRRWHLAEEEKTSRFLTNPKKTAFSRSRRRELLPRWIPACLGQGVWSVEAAAGGSALSFSGGWSSCPKLQLWVCPDGLPWSQGWHAAISLPLLSSRCEIFLQISLSHLACSRKLMERNPLLGAGEILAKSSELLC